MKIVEIQQDFNRIYSANYWNGEVSRSGRGSDPDQTHFLIPLLANLIKQRGIKSVLDLGCGDLCWMQHVLPGIYMYLGVDVVQDVIDKNRVVFDSEDVQFLCDDITRVHIPDFDLILCRDAICHMTYEDAFRLINNVRVSRAKWFLTTTIMKDGLVNPETHDLPNSSFTWYPVILTKPPFNFPAPVEVLEELPAELWSIPRTVPGKVLGLWRVEDIPCLL
jgi:SAM-dependent methyltransferase